MSKRKLSRQQAFRVQRIQEERIARASRRDAAATALLESGELGAEEEGLVTAHYGTQIEVEALQGAHAGHVFRCHLRANLETLVTGDRVIWQAPAGGGRETAPDTDDAPDAGAASLSSADGSVRLGVVTALLPRETLLVRPDPYGKLKPVAANAPPH